jgi:1,2-diacylglycerol 3-alpha-glucosyltransferase
MTVGGAPAPRHLRVALAVQHYPPYVAGAELQARLLARHLGEALGACDVITSRFRRDLPSRSEEGTVRVRRLPARRAGRGRRAVNFVSAFVYFLINGHRYDIVHAFCLSAFSLGAVLAAGLRGATTVLRPCTTGSLGEVATLQRSFRGRRLWRGFLRADAFIGQTRSMVSDLVARGVPAERIACVPNMLRMGVDEVPDGQSRRRARARLGLPERTTVLFVGRLVEGKGLDVLSGAWKRIAAEHDASLVLVGDGPEAGRLARWADDAGISDSVLLAGERQNPESYYRAADIFAFPSRTESFGNALAEAMAFGLAIVSSPVGLADDSIEDGRNGILVRERSAEKFASAIGALLADRERRERLGREARETALGSFAPDLVVRACLRVYQHVSDGAARQPLVEEEQDARARRVQRLR